MNNLFVPWCSHRLRLPTPCCMVRCTTVNATFAVMKHPASKREAGSYRHCSISLVVVVLIVQVNVATCFTTFSSRARSSTVVMLGRNDAGVDKGFNLLETASKVIPQGRIVGTVKETWKFGWKRMMAELAPQDKTGTYQRPSYAFGGKIGDASFPDEPGRYHLYVGNPCPWCHRARLVLGVRGIDTRTEVGVTQLVDDPVKASRGGWVFSSTDKDPLANCRDLRELYDCLSPGFTGRCTAPLLIDLKSKKIVSNESSEIVRMLNAATFGKSDNNRMNLYPAELASIIDETNEWVYRLVNNGVYRCGFSTTQAAYDRASADVRQGLAKCEDLLSKQDFLCGSQLTEADLRLIPTALRFDGVYAPLFKAGGTHLRIRDYPALYKWLKRCWSINGVPDSIDLEDANASYYKQLFPLNPGGIIPTKVTAIGLGLE